MVLPFQLFAQTQNLISNASFENDVTGSFVSSGNAVFGRVETPHSGSWSLWINASGGTNSWATVPILAQEGKTYTSAVWVKRELPDGYADLVINFIDLNGQVISGEVVQDSGKVYVSDWQQITTIATSPIGTQSMQIVMRMNGSGKAWFDDLSLFVGNPSGNYGLQGDANGDGIVGGADYVIWLVNFGKTNANGATEGDFNADQRVSGADYVILLKNYGNTYSPPQPTSTPPTPTPSPTQTPVAGTSCSLEESKFAKFEPLVVPNGLGAALHPATSGTSTDKAKILNLGMPYGRSEVRWESVESTPGSGNYNFSMYDQQVQAYAAAGLKPFFIIISHNAIGGSASYNIVNPTQRSQFARMAGALAGHFKGQGIPWEIWNEPDNDKFWPDGTPSADEYFELLKETANAIRQADPDAIIIGPSVTSDVRGYFDLPYIERLLQLGMANYIDGLSVHPYTAGSSAERTLEYYGRIKTMLNQYAPGKSIPLIGTEWGYENTIQGTNTSGWAARNTIRHFILGYWQEMPIQIYFALSGEPWGLYNSSGSAWPKATATEVMIDNLKGYKLERRLTSNNPSTQYFMLFSNCNAKYVVVAWRAAAGGWNSSIGTESYTLPLPAGNGEIVSMTGSRQAVSWGSGGLTITLTEDPQYIIFNSSQQINW